MHEVLEEMRPKIQTSSRHYIIPGLATAHSHAFQRGLRGRTQRQATAARSFWSWRDLMYRLAAKLDPESIYALSFFAYVELAMSGVTAVGEFHYVHHAPEGRPYADRLAMSEAVIQAAKDAGVRLCLIRTAYLRGGYEQELTHTQRRFADPDVASVLHDVEELRKRHARDPQITVALAAHSIRAVPLAAVQALSQYAGMCELPFHMHVAEQRRELDESRAEYGQTPVALLADIGALSPQFVAVHATHLNQDEIVQMGRAQSRICLCRTTERDLGDGLPQTATMIEAGVKLCVGVDSHCSPDAFEEIRALELDERSRTERRIVAATAPDLLTIGTKLGCEAIGFAPAWKRDAVYLCKEDAAFAGASAPTLADALIYGATPRAVDQVVVGDQQIVVDGVHVRYAEARQKYTCALAKLLEMG